MTVTRIVVLLLALVVVGAALSLRLRARSPLRVSYAIGAMSPEAYDLPGWRRWHVTLADGVVLNGLVRRPKAAAAPWILFFPGNDPAQLATGQAAADGMLGGEDWGAAVVAYRGFSGSGGVPHVQRLQRDGVAIYDALRADEHLSTAQLHIAAFSIGGNIASFVTSELSRRAAPAPSLSLLASVSYFVLVRPGPFEKWVSGDAFRTLPLLSGVPAPVLVVQGADDQTLLGPGQGRAIAATLGARAEYVELPGVAHLDLLTNTSALARVHAFVAAHLRPPNLPDQR